MNSTTKKYLHKPGYIRISSDVWAVRGDGGITLIYERGAATFYRHFCPCYAGPENARYIVST